MSSLKVSKYLAMVLVLTVTAGLPAVDTADAPTYYRLGINALAMDDPYAAVDSFRSAIRLNPAYADARLGMAEALFLLGEYDDAYREINEARRYAAGTRSLILLEARILTAVRDYRSAEELYFSVLRERPHDGDANRGLAEIYALQGQRELAEAAYDLSLRYSPGDRRALLQLVILHDEEQDRDSAEAALAEVLRRYPDSLEVRLQAAEHYALYQDWRPALDHLDRARAMVEPSDSRYRRVGLLDAELAINRGDSPSAVGILNSLNDRESPDVLYLMALAYRNIGDEESAQDRASRLLRLDNEDEIARMFREEALFLTAGGFDSDRDEAASWHLERGRRFEVDFYYQRAFASYRRARLISKTDPEVWIAYTNLIRKMGFPEHFSNSLEVALDNIPESHPRYGDLKRQLDLLDHSSSNRLVSDWGIDDPWGVETSSWTMGVYVSDGGNSLPVHPGSAQTLGLYFADVLDFSPHISVPVDRTGRSIEIGSAPSFADAFKESRGAHDYFAVLRFAETERTFSASCEVYISRSGELVGRYEEFRTGQGRVSDTLHRLAAAVASDMPGIMEILALDGERGLLDKGSWHGIETEQPWIVVRGDAARPALVEGGLEYHMDDYLGTMDLENVTEALSEGRYNRYGDFDFLRTGDQLFLLPEPETVDGDRGSPDPAFRARLLSIP